MAILKELKNRFLMVSNFCTATYRANYTKLAYTKLHLAAYTKLHFLYFKLETYTDSPCHTRISLIWSNHRQSKTWTENAGYISNVADAISVISLIPFIFEPCYFTLNIFQEFLFTYYKDE